MSSSHQPPSATDGRRPCARLDHHDDVDAGGRIVSGTLPGADVRGFYSALGIELPGWAQEEASIACFADPDAHARGDRDPSCSVNVETGRLALLGVRRQGWCV